jgi:hypothetical protein
VTAFSWAVRPITGAVLQADLAESMKERSEELKQKSRDLSEKIARRLQAGIEKSKNKSERRMRLYLRPLAY